MAKTWQEIFINLKLCRENHLMNWEERLIFFLSPCWPSHLWQWGVRQCHNNRLRLKYSIKQLLMRIYHWWVCKIDINRAQWDHYCHHTHECNQSKIKSNKRLCYNKMEGTAHTDKAQSACQASKIKLKDTTYQ